MLDAALLFMVLLYVYPLKFMFDSMCLQVFGLQPGGREIVMMSLSQLARASMVDATGFIALFVLFALLYAYAYSRRHELALSPVEMFDVKMFGGHHLVGVSVGIVARQRAVHPAST